MRLLSEDETERGDIKSVAKRWKDTYCRGGIWNDYGKTHLWNETRQPKHVYDALRCLDINTATSADVAAIIGNDMWTGNECSECDKKTDALVKFDSDADDEMGLCADCLREALAMLGSLNNTPATGALKP